MESKVKALKASWVIRICKNDNAKWKSLPAVYFGTDNLCNFFQFNQSKKKYTVKFYQDIQNYWSELQCIENVNKESILNQVIWNNRYITIDKKTFMWKNWSQHGILYIKDLLHTETNLFYSHDELQDKYHIEVTFLNALQIRHCIPLEWRSVIKSVNTCTCLEDQNKVICVLNGNKMPMSSLSCKLLYGFFVQHKQRLPACINKWTQDFPKFVEAADDLWENIFKLPFNTIEETKIQSFQFKLIHRIINCNKKLFDMKLIDNPVCNYCNNNIIDDLKHFFLWCPQVFKFWQSLFEWINRTQMFTSTLTTGIADFEENILFGFQIVDNVFQCINYVILIAKFFIYRQRLFANNNIDFLEFLGNLKYKLKVKQISEIRNVKHETLMTILDFL